MSNIDPYATTNALARGYQFAGQMQEDKARRTAGNALAQDDLQGAVSALGEVGAVEDVARLQDGQTRRDAAEQTREAEQQEQIRDFMLRGTTALRAAAPDARDQVYQQLRPTLAQIYPPEVMAQMDASPKDDATLDSLIAALGGESQTFNTRDGIVRVGPAGTPQVVYQPEPQDPAAPAGYRWTTDNNLEVIPGGPADPRVVRQRSAAGRAPPRARSGGGGGGSRPSGGSAPAAPSRKPWERF